MLRASEFKICDDSSEESGQFPTVSLACQRQGFTMWTCPKCGEAIEDQFDSCWKCAPAQSSSAAARAKLKTSDYLIAAGIAYLIPWFSLILQSEYVYWRGAVLVDGITFRLLVGMLIPAVM